MNMLEDTNIEELMFSFFCNHCEKREGTSIFDSALYAAFLNWLNNLVPTCGSEEAKREITLTSFTPERFRQMLLERGYHFKVDGSSYTGLIYTWLNITLRLKPRYESEP